MLGIFNHSKWSKIHFFFSWTGLTLNNNRNFRQNCSGAYIIFRHVNCTFSILGWGLLCLDEVTYISSCLGSNNDFPHFPKAMDSVDPEHQEADQDFTTVDFQFVVGKDQTFPPRLCTHQLIREGLNKLSMIHLITTKLMTFSLTTRNFSTTKSLNHPHPTLKSKLNVREKVFGHVLHD